jgi:hypothetical protein
MSCKGRNLERGRRKKGGNLKEVDDEGKIKME